MTRLEKLISIFGSQEKLAAAVGMSRSHVGHWIQPKHRHYREVIEPKFNNAVRKAAGVDVEALLDECCPTCGRVYDQGTVPENQTRVKVKYAGSE